eukprot:jgi/Mesen1/6675/ME000343S05845
MASLLNKVGTVFGAGDTLPWTDTDTIIACERELSSGEQGKKNNTDSMMRLAWALVHSRRPSDVNRGIAMLEAQLSNKASPDQQREVLYLLGVGHYRAGEYIRSKRLVDQALQVAPDFRQALTLKRMVDERISADGMIGMGIAAGAVALLVGGLATLASRRR